MNDLIQAGLFMCLGVSLVMGFSILVYLVVKEVVK